VGRAPTYPGARSGAERQRLFSLAEAHFQSPAAGGEQGPRLRGPNAVKAAALWQGPQTAGANRTLLRAEPWLRTSAAVCGRRCIVNHTRLEGSQGAAGSGSPAPGRRFSHPFFKTPHDREDGAKRHRNENRHFGEGPPSSSTSAVSATSKHVRGAPVRRDVLNACPPARASVAAPGAVPALTAEGALPRVHPAPSSPSRSTAGLWGIPTEQRSLPASVGTLLQPPALTALCTAHGGLASAQSPAAAQSRPARQPRPLLGRPSRELRAGQSHPPRAPLR